MVDVVELGYMQALGKAANPGCRLSHPVRALLATNVGGEISQWKPHRS